MAMLFRNFRTFLLLFLLSAGLAFPQEPVTGKYSVVGGLIGSLAGVMVGGIGGGLAAGPSVERCQERTNSEWKGLCSFGILYGSGVGAGIGYSLGVPVGGHLRGGLWNRKFALNMAAITLLTGTLALVDYNLYEAYDEKSLRFTVPLNLLAPPIVSYLIGR